MEIVRTILTVVYFVIALVVIILALIQTKDDSGLSQTITGSSTSNFYEKNKGRTKEGKQKRMMVVSSIIFGVLTLKKSFDFFLCAQLSPTDNKRKNKVV